VTKIIFPLPGLGFCIQPGFLCYMGHPGSDVGKLSKVKWLKLSRQIRIHTGKLGW